MEFFTYQSIFERIISIFLYINQYYFQRSTLKIKLTSLYFTNAAKNSIFSLILPRLLELMCESLK
jgi:hypothetical protein